MGWGGFKRDLPEIEETRRATRDAAFDEIVEKIKASGAEITEDETYPLYTEVGDEEFEIGYKQVMAFSLNRIDFQLTRKVETHILQGAGHKKHIEELESPRSHIILKKKPQLSNEWEVVDLEALF